MSSTRRQATRNSGSCPWLMVKREKRRGDSSFEWMVSEGLLVEEVLEL